MFEKIEILGKKFDIKEVTNKTIHDCVFDVIKEAGFTPYNVEKVDGYFLMTGSEYSITHFRIKEVNKHWKFGLWCREEALSDENIEKFVEEDKEEKLCGCRNYHEVFNLFAQWDRDIDKFKPTRSDVLVTGKLSKDTFYDDNMNPYDLLYVDTYERVIENMLKMLKRHPIMCWNGFCGYSEYYPMYARDSFLLPFLKSEFYHFKRWMKHRLVKLIALPILKFKAFKVRHIQGVTECKLEPNDLFFGYDYEIHVKASDEISENGYSKIFKIFNKRHFFKYDYSDYIAEFDGVLMNDEEGRERLYGPLEEDMDGGEIK